MDDLQFDTVCRTIEGLLARFGGRVRGWGGEVDVEWENGPEEGAKRWKRCRISFERTLDPSSVVRQSQTVTLHLVASSKVYLTLPDPSETGLSFAQGAQTPTAITDLANLSSLLAKTLQACLVRNVSARIGRLEEKGEGKEGKTCCFADDVKGVAVLQWTRGQMQVPPLLLPSSFALLTTRLTARAFDFTDWPGRRSRSTRTTSPFSHST